MIASRARVGFTMVEILIATAILGLCFVPVLMHSRQATFETEESQENLLARHYLMDIVERFRDSNLDELRPLAAAKEPVVVLGQDSSYITSDAVLSDVNRIL